MITVDKIVFRLAGILILVGLALGYWVHPAWLLLTAFVGINMLIASFTGFCIASEMLKKMGIKTGCSF